MPLTGWHRDPKAVEAVLSELPRPVAADLHWLRESGKGKVALLHKALVQVAGRYPVRAQTIGDCVSHGFAGAVDVLQAVEIVHLGQSERWVAEAASEPIYAGSRVEVGGGRLRGDGSVGAWAAKWVKDWGVLPRQRYGQHDLTTYSGQRAKAWGRPREGVPDDLEAVAKSHPVNEVTLVESYEQARDLIANGCPIAVCSDRGFAMRRDEKGFARPSGRWMHCMMFCAVDDADPRPGLLCVNTWGPDWITGPTRHDQPPGSFWTDADVGDRMLRQGDSFALSGYEGFPRQSIDWSLA